MGSERINRRALVIVLGIFAFLLAIYFPIRYFQDNSLRRSALAQARKLFDDGQSDLALATVGSYLENWPDDSAGLELLGELLAKTPTSADQILGGIDSIDKLLRLDPAPPARQEDRKRLVLLLIRLGDMVRASSDQRKSGLDKFEGRYQYANIIAEQRIKLGADDAEAHRLLAMTFEKMALGSDVELEAKAIKEYQKALRKDPGDLISAEHLAAMRMERKDGQGKPELASADQIFDSLIKARPRSVEARLLRARHFLKTNREDRAKADLETATRLDANSQGIRLMAASLAVKKGDAASAKRYLATIPEKDRLPTYDILSAQVEILDRHPDKAIEKLRLGLARSAGTDPELTFYLAYSLIQNGRIAEARPLIHQYRRLCGRRESSLHRLLEGALREKSGRYSSAITEFEAVREDINEEWKGELELAIGRCYEAIHETNLAREAFENARKLLPTSATPRQSLARLLLETNPARAAEELAEALRLAQGPLSGSIQADLVQALMARQLALPVSGRDWSAANAAMEQALRSRPDEPNLHLARARLFVAQGKLDEAETKLAESTGGICRTSPELWIARARQLESRGRINEALRVLEQASSPKAAGDQATIRVGKASLLTRTGRGRAALELLTLGASQFSPPDRALLIRARSELLLQLGDHAGAVAACVEWAGLNSEDPAPGLMLVEIARRGGTPEELEQGLDLLRKAGGDVEPFLMAAQAIALLLPRADDSEVDPSKLDQAETLSVGLQTSAPKLPATALVRAILLEQASDVEEAIAAYKEAINGDLTGLALPRLVAMLTRLKRPEEIAALKSKAVSPAKIDRIAVRQTLETGDKDQAEALLTKLVADQPDSLEYSADLARVLRDLGKPEQGEAILRALVDRHPDRPQPWLALLTIELERGDKVAANATVERMRKDYKGDRANLLLSRCLWTIGNRPEAARVAEAELASHPEDLETLRLGSEIEEANGRVIQAEALVVKARQIDPNLLWPRRKLALIYSSRYNAQRWPEAKALMAPVDPAKGDSLEDRLIRAIVLERGPDAASHAEAIASFRSLAEDLPYWQPIGNRARLSLASALLKEKDPAGASIAMAPLVAERAAPSPSSLAIAIEANSLAGIPEEARRLFERLVKLDPDSQMTKVCRALVLRAEGDPQAAASAILDAAAGVEQSADGEMLNRYYFEQLVRIGPDDAIEKLARKMTEKWPTQGVALARFYVSKGRIDEAFAICKATVEAGSAREPIALIVSLDSQGKLEETRVEKACELATSAAIQSAKDIELLSMATLLLRNHQRFEAEASLYRKILETDPSNFPARNNLAWVLARDLNRPEEGLTEVDQVIRQAGPIHQALDTRGMILIKLDRIDDAVVDFERSTKLAPTAVHQIHLARAYARAGRADDRRRALEAAKLALINPKSLDPEDQAELESLKP